MEEVQNNIKKWDSLFIKYNETEKKCIIYVSNINEIKNNLTKLLGNQKKDDIIFYKSIIDNSHFYLTSSLKIRKSKFIKDLNHVWFKINNCKEMDELNKSNISSLLKDYEKMFREILHAKENNTILTWVKNDMVESLHEIEKDFNETMEYHVNLIEYFLKMVENEYIFYCNK